MKWLFTFFLLLVIALAGIYLFIPSSPEVSVYRNIKASTPGTYRTLLNEKTWNRWWPKAYARVEKSNNTTYVYDKDTFLIRNASYNQIAIDIHNASGVLKSQLVFIPLAKDSLVLNWNFGMSTSTDPLKRIQQYREAADTKKNMDRIIDAAVSFCSKNENVYGISVSETSTVDTMLVFTTTETDASPSTELIYKEVKNLQDFLKQNQSPQTGNPMINVMETGKGNYKLMIALPTDTILKKGGKIQYKKMVPGRFITTNVMGGNEKINKAAEYIQQYFMDYQRVAMAIPFQVLITDRKQEPDSSKWITKLYFPVM